MEKLLTPRGGGNDTMTSPRISTPKSGRSIRKSGGISTVSPRKSSDTTSGVGQEWFVYKPLSNALDETTLSKWSRIIKTARAAGQFSCALCMLLEFQDYTRVALGFSVVHSSPINNLDQWAAREQHVLFKIHVPLLNPDQTVPPVYPDDYCQFGYLFASWFQPHVVDFHPESTEKISLEGKLPEFDTIRCAAEAAGQLECVLMPIQSGPDYTTIFDDKTATSIGYVLMPRFDVVKQWAARHNIRILVRVPDNPHIREHHSNSEQFPCDFGYLIANWEVPLIYTVSPRSFTIPRTITFK